MTEHPLEDDVANDPGQRVNPDPPRSPGTPEPPDLDVDPEQFLNEDERQQRASESGGQGDEPPS